MQTISSESAARTRTPWQRAMADACAQRDERRHQRRLAGWMADRARRAGVQEEFERRVGPKIEALLQAVVNELRAHGVPDEEIPAHLADPRLAAWIESSAKAGMAALFRDPDVQRDVERVAAMAQRDVGTVTSRVATVGPRLRTRRPTRRARRSRRPRGRPPARASDDPSPPGPRYLLEHGAPEGGVR